MKAMKRVLLGSLVIFAAGMLYLWGHNDGRNGIELSGEAQAESEAGAGWDPTQPSPKLDVYYPGTEALDPDEMRVIACGSGMPMPRLKQAAACFLIEL